MSDSTEPSFGGTTASLMSEIVLDLQKLFEQRLKLMQVELEEEVRLRARATAAFAVGLGMLFIASIVFSFSLVHMLNWAMANSDRSADLYSLWVCHVIVGTVISLTGGAFVWMGLTLFKWHMARSN